MSLAKVNFAMVPPLFLLTISILFKMVSFDIAGNSFWTRSTIVSRPRTRLPTSAGLEEGVFVVDWAAAAANIPS